MKRRESCTRKPSAIHRPTRRELLVAGGGLATVAGLSNCAGKPQPPVQKPRVSILKAIRYDDSLYDVVRRLLDEQNLNVRDKRVILKPNLVEFEPDTPINTHPVFVHAVYEALLARGAASVRIAEGPGHRRDALDLADAAGYFDSIRNLDELFHDLNLETVERVRMDKPFSKMREFYLPKVLLDADLIVSLAKLKTHHWVGATLTMKNFFGTVPGNVYGWPKNILHWSGIDQCIADLHSIYPRVFGMVDGIVGMEGNGPIQGTERFAGVIVGGQDLPAVDATCARIMGIDPERFVYLQLAARHGQMLAENVEQIGETIASVQTDFDLYGEFKEWRLKS
jgi:uncharacterized protein (DUF362 family)